VPCRQPSSAVRVVEAVSDCGGSQVQVELDLGDDTQAGRLYRPMVVPGQLVTTLRFTYTDSITRPGRRRRRRATGSSQVAAAASQHGAPCTKLPHSFIKFPTGECPVSSAAVFVFYFSTGRNGEFLPSTFLSHELSLAHQQHQRHRQKMDFFPLGQVCIYVAIATGLGSGSTMLASSARRLSTDRELGFAAWIHPAGFPRTRPFPQNKAICKTSSIQFSYSPIVGCDDFAGTSTQRKSP
jgi:hypothetical protein